MTSESSAKGYEKLPRFSVPLQGLQIIGVVRDLQVEVWAGSRIQVTVTVHTVCADDFGMAPPPPADVWPFGGGFSVVLRVTDGDGGEGTDEASVAVVPMDGGFTHPGSEAQPDRREGSGASEPPIAQGTRTFELTYGLSRDLSPYLPIINAVSTMRPELAALARRIGMPYEMFENAMEQYPIWEKVSQGTDRPFTRQSVFDLLTQSLVAAGKDPPEKKVGEAADTMWLGMKLVTNKPIAIPIPVGPRTQPPATIVPVGPRSHDDVPMILQGAPGPYPPVPYPAVPGVAHGIPTPPPTQNDFPDAEPQPPATKGNENEDDEQRLWCLKHGCWFSECKDPDYDNHHPSDDLRRGRPPGDHGAPPTPPPENNDFEELQPPATDGWLTGRVDWPSGGQVLYEESPVQPPAREADDAEDAAEADKADKAVDADQALDDRWDAYVAAKAAELAEAADAATKAAAAWGAAADDAKAAAAKADARGDAAAKADAKAAAAKAAAAKADYDAAAKAAATAKAAYDAALAAVVEAGQSLRGISDR